MPNKELDKKISEIVSELPAHLKRSVKGQIKKLVAPLNDKANRWDELEEKISKYYPEDIEDLDEQIEEDGGSLLDIGETAARAFGYM